MTFFRRHHFSTAQLLGVPPLATAVTLDAFTGAVQAAGAAVWVGVDHVMAADADYAVVMVAHEASSSVSVTFGGVAMNVGPVAGPADGSLQALRSYWLSVADLPAPGTVSVVVDPSVSLAGYAGIWTLKGTAAVGPNRNHTNTANTGTSVAVTLASVPAGAAILSGQASNHTDIQSLSAGGTQKYANNTAAGGQTGIFGDSFPGGAGTVTHTYSGPSAQRRAAVMLEIIPEALG